MQINVREDDLSGAAIRELLTTHLDHAAAQAPPESTHALDLDSLRETGVTFWTAWHGGDLLGCGALKELDASHGEIKSMHTAEAFRGRGIAARMVEHLLGVARERGYRRLSLETGSMEGYRAARELYARFGFVECPPFADYRPDPNSVFMTLELT
ncbi:MAG: GNAT family N-acetyltransferase [Pseudomonadota bacterium]